MNHYAFAQAFVPRPTGNSTVDAAQAGQAVLAARGASGARAVGGPDDAKPTEQIGAVECQTCKDRKYQDGSNDPGVSFKTPGHIDPANAQSVVRAHEQEHVSNEQAKAQSGERKVVSQSVRLFTSVCPECGRSYVSGGVTRTVTASAGKQTQGSPYKTEGSPRGKLLHATA
jgi:hypothetical protein